MEAIGEMWDFLIKEGIATDNELQLVTRLHGYNLETLTQVLEIRTGYHSMEQYIYCEGITVEEE